MTYLVCAAPALHWQYQPLACVRDFERSDCVRKWLTAMEG
jgi:hypothetical protein